MVSGEVRDNALDGLEDKIAAKVYEAAKVALEKNSILLTPNGNIERHQLLREIQVAIFKATKTSKHSRVINELASGILKASTALSAPGAFGVGAALYAAHRIGSMVDAGAKVWPIVDDIKQEIDSIITRAGAKAEQRPKGSVASAPSAASATAASAAAGSSARESGDQDEAKESLCSSIGSMVASSILNLIQRKIVNPLLSPAVEHAADLAIGEYQRKEQEILAAYHKELISRGEVQKDPSAHSGASGAQKPVAASGGGGGGADKDADLKQSRSDRAKEKPMMCLMPDDIMQFLQAKQAPKVEPLPWESAAFLSGVLGCVRNPTTYEDRVVAQAMALSDASGLSMKQHKFTVQPNFSMQQRCPFQSASCIGIGGPTERGLGYVWGELFGISSAYGAVPIIPRATGLSASGGSASGTAAQSSRATTTPAGAAVGLTAYDLTMWSLAHGSQTREVSAHYETMEQVRRIELGLGTEGLEPNWQGTLSSIAGNAFTFLSGEQNIKFIKSACKVFAENFRKSLVESERQSGISSLDLLEKRDISLATNLLKIQRGTGHDVFKFAARSTETVGQVSMYLLEQASHTMHVVDPGSMALVNAITGTIGRGIGIGYETTVPLKHRIKLASTYNTFMESHFPTEGQRFMVELPLTIILAELTAGGIKLAMQKLPVKPALMVEGRHVVEAPGFKSSVKPHSVVETLSEFKPHVLADFPVTEPVSISGRRPIDLGHYYQQKVSEYYGVSTSREYSATVSGKSVQGIADHVLTVDSKRVAVEAKYVDNWGKSLRNPVHTEPWALIEQQKMIDQAKKYSAGFDGGVYYHTNSLELAECYTEVFNTRGIKNFKFIITPAKK